MKGDRFERNGETRRVTGVWRPGQGKGKGSAVTGRVWWTGPDGRERSCTFAAWNEWLGVSDDRKAGGE
jgi:hypothetical protein